MLKKVGIICSMLIFTLFIGGQALAVNQLPNAEVRVTYYTDLGGTGVSPTSAYCTATQSHINLRVDNTKGTVTTWLEYRGPNQAWKSYNTTGKTIYGKGSYTYNMNAVKGYDYRVKVKGSLTSKASGVVMCW